MTETASHPEREPDDEGSFPDEGTWLTLPCPEVAPDFVERTWQRVRTADAIGADPDAIALPREILDAYTVPAPSPGFVEATLAATRAPAWRDALTQHRVPEPSPTFVERVLQSLREQPEPARGRGVLRHLTTARMLSLATAAAALVVAAVLLTASPDRVGLPFEVLSSHAFSPDPWAVALSSLSDRGLAVTPDDAALRLGELAGLGIGR